ncbi:MULTISPECIES: DUF805 domain-containing protein [Asticcacaulis]|uniref:DUF805 domain-containing protein n=1 Tax=Asticcacaulis TaxID=76890 RepID=UPI001AE1AA92|nr:MULTISPECIES: DUF805 domain-containing protein [Asticcacaulis]MBP2158668.1 uncharacterized membrane protein YhaH (DUF805 family) [Asticcacaulis solisilvae]MDR6799714.1 uncharacterized membrane protein YhaH (DUF805 family) [Asticcacaulis sp. BE141]
MLMLQPLRKYFDFSGRASRAEYWQFVLFQFVVGFILSFAAAVSGGNAGLNILSGLFSLAMMIPTITAGVRRLHDINRTGWWIILPSAVLMVTLTVFIFGEGTAIAQNFASMSWEANPSDGVRAAVGALGSLMTWVVLPTWLASLVTFVFHITEGTSGPNRFGPDPRGGRTVDISVFDDERVDAAIAEAKAGKRERDSDYKPVFDFTSPLPTATASAAPPPPVSPAPARTTPTFGKRR